ncbi:uncharacterized protein Pyn_39373 [Prunus yedoensis var. nudiflora]|uniref:Uncharacterized protein n=1 Tax=Prunus yedoensis var. nudiflora TaxID=2094558 RepID=A0A314XYY6_PRUYE|nr:uncharacterized protein Pyn_39373 [Prunus yedoensis var. nudiflora]
MLGTGLQVTRARGDDRFYDPVRARRAHQNQKAEQLRRAQSDVTPSQSPSLKGNPNREPENRVGSDDPPKPVAVPAFEPVVNPLSNLERFLQSISPSVPAQHLSKTTMRGLSTCGVEFRHTLFLEIYGSLSRSGVLMIYGHSMKSPTKTRRPDEDSDSEFRDSSSDGSSDYETDRLKYLREQRNHQNLSSEIPGRIERLSLREPHFPPHEDCSSDEGESINSQGCLLFEYFEQDLPYCREPLADKILDLAYHFPELKTLRSCDLLSSSWISVAWYPIYRIPTGPTLKDLDACFLTYHSLFTSMGGVQEARAPLVTYPSDMDGVPKMSLPVFGLASYKFRGSLWTPNGGFERQLANSLSQAADNFLRVLQVNHPDFVFFSRR